MNFVSLLKELLSWSQIMSTHFLTGATKTWIYYEIYAMHFENILLLGIPRVLHGISQWIKKPCVLHYTCILFLYRWRVILKNQKF